MLDKGVDCSWSKMRSLFFVPAHVSRFYEKAIESEADVIVLDLEDGAPKNKKDEARNNVRKYLNADRMDKKILVRVNPLGSPYHQADINACILGEADGVVLPKTRSQEDIKSVTSAMMGDSKEGGFSRPLPALFPLIESAEAVLNLREIAHGSFLTKGLIFGHEDYLNDVGALHSVSELNLLFARTQLVLVAKERGIVPIDTPFLRLRDSDGCLNHAKFGRELGFKGMLVLHPDQVEIANNGYSPSQAEIENALEVLAIRNEANNSDRSIAFTSGKFVAPPIIKQAESLIKRAQELGLMNINSTSEEV